MPDGSEFQTVGAATLKPREAKQCNTYIVGTKLFKVHNNYGKLKQGKNRHFFRVCVFRITQTAFP